jgi:hypothetical protein
MGTDLIVKSLEVYQVSKSQKLTRIAFINMKGLVCRTIIRNKPLTFLANVREDQKLILSMLIRPSVTPRLLSFRNLSNTVVNQSLGLSI